MYRNSLVLTRGNEMIGNSKQQWEVGQTVRAGFMSVVVKAKCFTPGDGLPDLYICANAAGDKLYSFVPHNGCARITTEEAREAMAVHRRHADRLAAIAIARAKGTSAVAALFA
jgi:hypothetical protein